MENKRSRDVVVLVCHHAGKRIMAGVILAALDFKGQHIALVLDDEVQFSLLFAVEVVQRIAVGGQLLGGGVLKHRAEIDVLFAVQQRQLDAVGVGSRQQPHIAEKQLEQVALSVQPQRQRRFFHVVGRQRNAGVGQPQKTIVVAA